MITMTIDNDHLLPVADLVDRPGASRPLALRLAVPSGLAFPLVEFVAPVALNGVAESVVEGILVRGTVSIRLQLACARCLVDLEVDVTTPVTELFSDPDELVAVERAELEAGYELREGMLDLETLLRDALMTAVPLQPLCDEACAGLCPDCGARRAEVACDCDEQNTDPRWAALSELRLPSTDPEE
jgi:uncharacterized protein